MQTFLPYPSYRRSAECLDRQRLNKQRVECKQILTAIRNPDYGWQNHPAVNQWRGYEYQLCLYSLAMCDECDRRGIQDKVNIRLWFVTEMTLYTDYPELPPWLGKRSYHKSHKSNLIRKFPQRYGKMFPNVPDNLPYVWPSKVKGWM